MKFGEREVTERETSTRRMTLTEEAPEHLHAVIRSLWLVVLKDKAHYKAAQRTAQVWQPPPQLLPQDTLPRLLPRPSCCLQQRPLAVVLPEVRSRPLPPLQRLL